MAIVCLYIYRLYVTTYFTHTKIYFLFHGLYYIGATFVLTQKRKHINTFYEFKGNAFYKFTSITSPFARDSHSVLEGTFQQAML